MDRALGFFLDTTLLNNNNNTQGLQTTPFVQNTNTTKLSNDEIIVANEIIKTKLELKQSYFNPNEYINYRGNSGTNEIEPWTYSNDKYDSRISSIIEWINKYKALTLQPWMFAYLKDVAVYPANKLQILRRFPGGVGHDLFSHKSAPISTLVSYMKPEQTTSVAIDFSEEWTTEDDGFLAVMSDVIGGVKIFGYDGGVPAMDTISPAGEVFIGFIADKLGLTDIKSSPRGNPNMIHEAAIRESSYKGLNFDFNYEFTTTFIQKDIQAFGIDPEIAMLELIGQCVKMGTSNSEFIISGNASGVANEIITKLTDLDSNNDTDVIDILASAAKNALTGLTTNLAKLWEKTTDATEEGGIEGGAKFLGGEALGAIVDFIKFYISAFYWRLYGAAASMTGLNTAPWHLTLGNPKAPYFTIGNLICSNVNLELNNEYGYSDMPTEVKVKCTLKNGRRLGAQEISSLFNVGKGRIYFTPDKIKNRYEK
jgi:hypothetical protein